MLFKNYKGKSKGKMTTGLLSIIAGTVLIFLLSYGTSFYMAESSGSIISGDQELIESNLSAGILNLWIEFYKKAPDADVKLYSLHKIELRDGVTGEELERFFNERFFPNWEIEGWNSFLLKGDRGERKGRYMLIHEMDSVEMRNRYFPEPDVATEEWDRQTEGLSEIGAELSELVSVYLGEVYTDYFVVGNQ